MDAPHLDPRNRNTLWSSVLVETLVRLGAGQAVISPGSRSTPLTVALVAHPGIEAMPVLDERSAAFFALGLARRSGCPVILVCTSGTAGANYYPAVVEARESGVPLLVFTADRPPELRDCHSGQTIDQQALFGRQVGFYHELACPSGEVDRLRYLRQMVAYAFNRARCPRCPVHLNVPFRDPLAPEVESGVGPLSLDALGESFFKHLTPPRAWDDGVRIPVRLPKDACRVLVVAGVDVVRDPERYAKAVGSWVKQYGFPLIADGVSPLRHHDVGARVLTSHESILRDPELARLLAPDHVVCLGDWPANKALREWIQACDPSITQISPQDDNRDGLHARTVTIRRYAEEVGIEWEGAMDPEFVRVWDGASEASRVFPIKAPKGGRDALFAADIVRVVGESLPGGTPVFVASSMAVRDLDAYWPASNRGYPVYCNRGANGIDGTLSTALGVAHGGTPAVLVTGDLAFLHDSNGLQLCGKLRGSITVILINNDGGGIFEHLPIAKFEPLFENYFATPQTVDFASLCRAYGAAHEIGGSLEHLASVCRTLPAEGIRVIELRTNRKHDVAHRAEIAASRLASTRAALGLKA